MELQVRDIEIKEMARGASTGAALGLGEAASHHARTGKGSLAGQQTAGRRVNRRLAATVRGAAAGVLDALQPERAATTALGLVRSRARREDLLGEIAYWGLRTVNRSLADVSRLLGRLERASEPPARGAAGASRAVATSPGGSKRGRPRTARAPLRTRRAVERAGSEA